jgi:hypothetical protein
MVMAIFLEWGASHTGRRARFGLIRYHFEGALPASARLRRAGADGHPGCPHVYNGKSHHNLRTACRGRQKVKAGT